MTYEELVTPHYAGARGGAIASSDGKNERREASPHPSPRGEGTADIAEVLSKLMYYRTPDGHYLVTRKVHWQAVYRVLVDEGWYDACNSLHLSGSSLYKQL